MAYAIKSRKRERTYRNQSSSLNFFVAVYKKLISFQIMPMIQWLRQMIKGPLSNDETTEQTINVIFHEIL